MRRESFPSEGSVGSFPRQLQGREDKAPGGGCGGGEEEESIGVFERKFLGGRTMLDVSGKGGWVLPAKLNEGKDL